MAGDVTTRKDLNAKNKNILLKNTKVSTLGRYGLKDLNIFNFLSNFKLKKKNEITRKSHQP